MSQNAPSPSERGRLLSKADVAEFAGITTRHARRIFEQRRIPVVKLGNVTRVWSSDLEAYLDANTRPAREADSRA